MKDQPQEFEILFLHPKDGKFQKVYRIVNIEAEFLKVAGDHIDTVALVVFVAKGLVTNFFEVLGIGAFELDDGECIAIFEDGAICFFGIPDIFEFGGQVIIRMRVDGVSQNINKKLPEKPFLELFFLDCPDIGPDMWIVKIGCIGNVRCLDGGQVLCRQVFFEDRILEKWNGRIRGVLNQK